MADTPRDAGLKQVPAPRNEKAPADFGYVGIDSILEQMRRKAMKQGFEFNIMVVGEHGPHTGTQRRGPAPRAPGLSLPLCKMGVDTPGLQGACGVVCVPACLPGGAPASPTPLGGGGLLVVRTRDHPAGL